MRTFIMMRTKGLVQPFVKKGSKPATVTAPKGVKSNGNYIRYKQLNP